MTFNNVSSFHSYERDVVPVVRFDFSRVLGILIVSVILLILIEFFSSKNGHNTVHRSDKFMKRH